MIADIGHNLRQDMVAGEQVFFIRLIQADMAGRVTGRGDYLEVIRFHTDTYRRVSGG